MLIGPGDRAEILQKPLGFDDEKRADGDGGRADDVFHMHLFISLSEYTASV